jgi:hypothetical protein
MKDKVQALLRKGWREVAGVAPYVHNENIHQIDNFFRTSKEVLGAERIQGANVIEPFQNL